VGTGRTIRLYCLKCNAACTRKPPKRSLFARRSGREGWMPQLLQKVHTSQEDGVAETAISPGNNPLFVLWQKRLLDGRMGKVVVVPRGKGCTFVWFVGNRVGGVRCPYQKSRRCCGRCRPGPEAATVPGQHDCAARRSVRRPPVYRPVASRSPDGDSRPPASAGRTPTPRAQTPASPPRRPPVPTRNPERAVVVGDLGRRLIPFPVSMTALLVACLAAFRASVRSRLELEAEILALRHQLAVLQRQAPRRPRLSRVDPLAVGTAVQDLAELATGGPNRHARHGRSLASVTNVALIPQESRLPARLDRLLHGPHGDFPRAIRVPGAVARPTAHRPRERHGPPDRGVDRAAAPRSMAVGHRAAIRHPRPRWDLRIGPSACCAGKCLDHLVVWNERSLRRYLRQYLAYYHEWRTHLSLDKDAPVPRAVHPPTCGTIVQVPHLGGLHHHYERLAA
jgi:hypothetical protein